MNTGLHVNGEPFSSYYGGEHRKIDPQMAEKYTRKGRSFGTEYSTLRKYHYLRRVAVDGKSWILVHAVDRNPCGEFRRRCFEYRSECGKYKVVKYGKKVFAFQCIGRANGMRSQFGNHANGIQKEFNSHLEALKAVATI